MIPARSAISRDRQTFRPSRRQSDKGVTLIEMMVVLVIIGVMAGLAISGLVPGTAQRKLSGAAEVLVQRLDLASDEAMVTGRPVAFDPRKDGYGFVQWHGETGWQPMETGPLAAGINLDSGISIATYSKDGTVLTSAGPYVISPDGAAAGFRIELIIAGQKRLIQFDGMNAHQINADAESDDGA